MIKLTSRRAALVLAGSALALAGGMLPAQAATTGWRADAKISVRGGLVLMTGIDAVSRSDAWAVGDSVTPGYTKVAGIIEHWTGRSWRRVSLPASIAKIWNAYSGLTFPVVGASSAANVWAFSQDISPRRRYDGYVRLNGSKWTFGQLPRTSVAAGNPVIITATRVISNRDVWVFGGKANAKSTSQSFSPYAAQYNGRRWVVKTIPGTGAVTSVSEISSGNMWAALGIPQQLGGSTTASTPSVVHWNGASWAAAGVQPTSAELPAGANLTSILASRGGHVWIGGGAPNTAGGTNEFAAELTGSTWTASTLNVPASSDDYELTSLAPDGNGGIWALAGSGSSNVRIWHLTAGSWTGPSQPSFGGAHRLLFQLAAVPGTRSVWGTGIVSSGSRVEGLIAIDGPTPR